MNRNLLIGIGILVIVIAVGALFVLKQQGKTSDESLMKKDESSMTKEDGQSDTMMEKSSSYIEYSKEVYEQNSDKKRVLYFYANWCPICRPLDKEISENADKIPKDVVILRVNYNDSDTEQEEKDLAKKYGVIYQHTFVQIDSAGNQVNKWSGGNFEELLANIK